MFSIIVTLIIIVTTVILMFKRFDVRLSLLVCAVALFLIAAKLPEVFVIITKPMTNEKTVVPICTAIGFAYVLKLTECHKFMHKFSHMVRENDRGLHNEANKRHKLLWMNSFEN